MPQVQTPEITVPSDALIRGLFVARLDRQWRDTPFMFQGFRIETDEEIRALQQLCEWVAVDPARSHPQALASIAQREADEAPLPDSRRSPDWLLALQQRKKTPSRRSIPPLEPLPAQERNPLVPAGVPLVRYREEVPFEREVVHANEAAEQASATLNRVLDELARGGELARSELEESAQHLAVSIVRNPDALQWLVRIRSESAAVHEHGMRVAVYLMSFARHLGFAPAELVHMASIGLLLDLGKIFVDRDLLERAGPLTEAERRQVQQHVTLGLKTLEESGELPGAVREGIAEHHERVDGRGYPSSVPGDCISIYGRMAAIADSFAAMTGPRNYARTHSPFDAMKTLNAEAGAKYHAPLVEQFLQAVGVFPTGSLIELTNGQLAVVVCHNRLRRLEPRVLVLTDAEKKRLDAPYELDLMRQQVLRGGTPLRIERGLSDGAFGIDLAALYAG